MVAFSAKFSSSICLIALSKIFFSVSCLNLLYSFNLFVRLETSFIFLDKNSCKASSAFPILPQALILGAIPKEILFESILVYPDD